MVTWRLRLKKSRKIVGLSKLESRLSNIPHSERNGTRSAIPSQGHSWRHHRNDWSGRTCQVSRGHCEDMSAKCQENKDTRTKKQKARERIRFAAVCWCLFLAGWNDGTTGPLLPRIQEVYHVCCPAFSLCPLYIFDFYLCLSRRSLSTSTVDHQVTGFHPGSSCQCTSDASVWIWKGGHRRWFEEIWDLGVNVNAIDHYFGYADYDIWSSSVRHGNA